MDNPFKAKEGQLTCNSCVHYERCAELNKSTEHLDGCSTCKCFEDETAMRRQVAKDILLIIEEEKNGKNGWLYCNSDFAIVNRIKEKYGVEGGSK